MDLVGAAAGGGPPSAFDAYATGLAEEAGVPLELVRMPADVLALENGCWFDATAAQAAIDFVQGFCRQSRGEWAGQPLILEGWQREEILRPLFGWMRPDGLRRFRTAYIEVPRKNGKSTLCAALGLLLLVGDVEPGAVVVTAASSRDQGREVFGESSRMVNKSPDLQRLLTVYRNSIWFAGMESTFHVVSADVGTKHGMNLHGLIADELHAWPDAELWDVLTTSQGARRQPLTVAITTAGFDRTTVCYAQHEYASGVLEGTIPDDSFFPYMAAMDQQDDWMLLENWIKANPGLQLDDWIAPTPMTESTGPHPVGLSAACPWRFDYECGEPYLVQLSRFVRRNPGYGRSPKLTTLVDAATKAFYSPAAQNGFRRLHGNVWTSQETRWLDMRYWDQCDGPVDVFRLDGRPCYVGLDLASRVDICCAVFVWPPRDWLELALERVEKPPKRGKKRKTRRRAAEEIESDVGVNYPDPTDVAEPWIIAPVFWVPEDTIEARSKEDQVGYDVWARQGHMVTCPGETNDWQAVGRAVLAVHQHCPVLEVGADPWNAASVVRELEVQGIAVAEVQQTTKGLSPPMQNLLGMLVGGVAAHGGQPVLRWMADNVVVSEDSNGNIRPDRKKSREKIDGIAALCDALNRALVLGGLWELKQAADRAAWRAEMAKKAGGEG